MFGMKVIPSGLCICNIFVQSSVYFIYFYQRIFDPKLCHFQKNVATQGVVCQVDISVLLMTTELKNIYFIFPKFWCWVLCQLPSPLVSHISNITWVILPSSYINMRNSRSQWRNIELFIQAWVESMYQFENLNIFEMLQCNGHE